MQARRRPTVTLHARTVYEVPEQTTLVARAAFPKGNI
jgi:hypothetical protein